MYSRLFLLLRGQLSRLPYPIKRKPKEKQKHNYGNNPSPKGKADWWDAFIKGSRKNKFTILGVEAPGWQDAKVQEYQVYSELSQHSQTGWIGG